MPQPVILLADSPILWGLKTLFCSHLLSVLSESGWAFQDVGTEPREQSQAGQALIKRKYSPKCSTQVQEERDCRKRFCYDGVLIVWLFKSLNFM